MDLQRWFCVCRDPSPGTPGPPNLIPQSHLLSPAFLYPLGCRKMLPKDIKNGFKMKPKTKPFQSLISCRFVTRHWRPLSSIRRATDTRFCCYLQHFRGVQHFSWILKNHPKWHPNLRKKITKRYPKATKNESQKQGYKNDAKWTKNAFPKVSACSPGSLFRDPTATKSHL